VLAIPGLEMGHGQMILADGCSLRGGGAVFGDCALEVLKRGLVGALAIESPTDGALHIDMIRSHLLGLPGVFEGFAWFSSALHVFAIAKEE